MSKARNLANLLADGSIGAAELAEGLDLSSKTITLPSASVPQLSLKRRYTTLRSNLTSIAGDARYTDDISSLITADTFAIIIALRYIHNGSTNHGYLTGYFCQQDQEGSENNRAYFSRSHYDWYYNNFEVEFVLPWNPSSSGNLITQIQSSYFTGDNRYGWEMKGVFEA